MTTPHLRIARPTNDIHALLPFYRDALGLQVLGSFDDHDGFDGVMLGLPGAGWHVELTREHSVEAPRAASEDHLLVLYLPNPSEWESAVQRMERAGFGAVRSHNPYWDQHGRTYEDPDGYRVVLQNAASPV